MIRRTDYRRLIDRESFLSFYFVLAIFCAGVGTLLGTDDLLVSFAAGCAFAWEYVHLSNSTDMQRLVHEKNRRISRLKRNRPSFQLVILRLLWKYYPLGHDELS